MDLRPGTGYLFEEARPDFSFRFFRALEERGTRSFCVSRLTRDLLWRQHGLRPSRYLWLSETPGPDHHSGRALASLAKEIEAFVRGSSEGGVVLLDGLEYLVTCNGFDATVAFVELLNEVVMTTRANLLIPVSPRAVGPRELAILERDLEVPDVHAWNDELERDRWSRRLERSA